MILAFRTLDGNRVVAQATAVSTIEEAVLQQPSVTSREMKTCVKIVMTNGREYHVQDETLASLTLRWRQRLRVPPPETNPDATSTGEPAPSR